VCGRNGREKRAKKARAPGIAALRLNGYSLKILQDATEGWVFRAPGWVCEEPQPRALWVCGWQDRISTERPDPNRGVGDAETALYFAAGTPPAA
jgi:hypothetical protein